MAINYTPTKWENGKTILRASHLEKIEKGITDIINYNNSIYIDEDRRKENEIKREEEHNKKIREVDTLVDDLKSDYDALEKIIIDENASANLQNQINDVASQLAHKAKQNFNLYEFSKYVVGDDWTIAIQTAIDEISLNGGVLYIPPGTYDISSTLTLKSGVEIKGIKEKTILKLTTNNTTLMLADGVNKFNIKGVKFVGSDANKTQRGLFISSWEANIIDCTFKGFDLAVDLKGVLINLESSYIVGNNTGVKITNQQENLFSTMISINRCLIHYNGIGIDANRNKDATRDFIGFYISKTAFEYNDYAYKLYHPMNGKIEDCWFEQNKNKPEVLATAIMFENNRYEGGESQTPEFIENPYGEFGGGGYSLIQGSKHSTSNLELQYYPNFNNTPAYKNLNINPSTAKLEFDNSPLVTSLSGYSNIAYINISNGAITKSNIKDLITFTHDSTGVYTIKFNGTDYIGNPVISVTSMPERSTPVTHQVIPKFIDEATYKDWFAVDTIQIKTFNTSNVATDAKISIMILFDKVITR